MVEVGDLLLHSFICAHFNLIATVNFIVVSVEKPITIVVRKFLSRTEICGLIYFTSKEECC